MLSLTAATWIRSRTAAGFQL